MGLFLRKRLSSIVLAFTFSTLLVVYLLNKHEYVSQYQYMPTSIIKTAYSKPNLINATNYKEFLRPIDFENSSAIFNTVLDALKQKNSDIHPVGVSFLPAIIPEGTLLYRSGTEEVPSFFAWLAMDHEFSYSFGSNRNSKRYGRKSLKKMHMHPKPKPKSTKGGNDDDDKYVEHDSKYDGKKPEGFPSKDEGSRKMMTFRATRDLNRFIYFDGASAAKSNTGEMDTQQLLSDVAASRLDLPPDDSHRQETVYAANICQWGKQFGLDGYIRVEIGFEIVFCDFHGSGLELVSSLENDNPINTFDLPEPTNITVEDGWPLNENGTDVIDSKLTKAQKEILAREDNWQNILDQYSAVRELDWIRAGNVHDTGDKRIKLDFKNLITAINRTEMTDNPYKRRVLNGTLDWGQQLQLVDELEQSIAVGYDYTKGTDWQLLFEEAVNKFTPILKIIENVLTNETMTSAEKALHATKYTLHFVSRFSNGAVSLNDQKFAVYQYTHPLDPLQTDADFLIWSSGVKVIERIVDFIYDLHRELLPIVKNNFFQKEVIEINEEIVLDYERRILDLNESLNWVALSYKCSEVCAWDEICLTPSWGPSPFGFGMDSSKVRFGTHFDEELDRVVIDDELSCVNINTLLSERK